MSERIKQIWRLISRPKVVVPILLAAALLGVAVTLSNLSRVFTRIAHIPVLSLGLTLLLAATYLICKGLQFRGFLKDLNLSIPWRSMLFAYLIGEVTVTLPLGIYAQNYLLQRLNGSRVSRTAAATTLMLMFEAGIFFLILALLGTHGWPWLRLIALGCLLGLMAFIAIVTRWKRLHHGAVRLMSYVKLPAKPVMEFLQSLGLLADSRIFWRRGYLTVLYVIALITAFHTIAHGVGVSRLGMLPAASIYAFSLSIALIFGGITSQVGVVEISGMEAARMYGFSYSEGLAMLFGFRLVWTACIWLICMPIVFWLRGELTESSGDGRQESSD